MAGISNRGGAVLALLAALASAAARADDPPATFTAQSSASESGTGEAAVQRIVNTTFAFDHVYQRGAGGGDRFVLYELEVASEQPLEAEGPVSRLTVTARNRAAGGYGDVLWTVRDNANKGWRCYHSGHTV